VQLHDVEAVRGDGPGELGRRGHGEAPGEDPQGRDGHSRIRSPSAPALATAAAIIRTTVTPSAGLGLSSPPEAIASANASSCSLNALVSVGCGRIEYPSSSR